MGRLVCVVSGVWVNGMVAMRSEVSEVGEWGGCCVCTEVSEVGEYGG